MKKFFYRVEKGESVFGLSDKFSVPAFVIIKLNNLRREIEEGDLLYIEQEPDRKIYSVKPCDTVESVAEKFCVAPQKLLDDNGAEYFFYGMKIYV